MNWYKIAQNLELTLLPSEYSESAFPATAKAIDDLNLTPILTEFATEKGFKSPIDYVFCSLYPEHKRNCLKYYRNGGRKLVDVVHADTLSKWDTTLSNAIMVFYKQYEQESQTENE